MSDHPEPTKPNDNASRPLWREQCDAARSIREDIGVEKALGYLLGEKLMQFIRDAEDAPELAHELPHFLAKVRQVFTVAELRAYFSGARAVGPLAHVIDAEGQETLRAAGVVEDDVAASAQEAIRFEQMRRLLLTE